MDSRTILLYGNSLLLSVIAAGLAPDDGLRVAQAATWEDALRLLAGGAPDAVIFDLADPCESHILALLLANPALVLLGLDPERNRGVLLRGCETPALTLNRIKEIIAARH